MLTMRIMFTVAIIGGLLNLCHGQDVEQKQEGEQNPLAGIKCIVSGENNAVTEHAAKHLDGKVFFCCNHCKTKFENDPEDYLVKANHQLVLTGQYVQTMCPITGLDIVEGSEIKLCGTVVGFCCNRCKGSLQSAVSAKAQAELIFTASAFSKGYTRKRDLNEIHCPVSGQPVAADFKSEYQEGVIYFCCSTCQQKFTETPERYTSSANFQLVATGQYKQVNCPFSGHKVTQDHQFKIGTVKVNLCSSSCLEKITKTEEFSEQIDLVFAAEPFAKAFASQKPVKE